VTTVLHQMAALRERARIYSARSSASGPPSTGAFQSGLSRTTATGRPLPRPKATEKKGTCASPPSACFPSWIIG